MAEEFASGPKGVANNTFIKNKDFGYPNAAGNPTDSLNHPNDMPTPNAVNTFLSNPISTVVGAYASFTFLAVSGYEYNIDPNAGLGTGTVVSGPSFPLAGDDTYKTVTVQVTGVGAGSQYEFGLVTAAGGWKDANLYSNNTYNNVVGGYAGDFNADGTELTTLTGNGKYDKYGLSTPYDITTASLIVSGNSLPGGYTDYTGFCWNGDGTEFCTCVSLGSVVHVFSCTTPL